MDSSKKTILVTGAAGLLGSHLTDTLLERGHRVTGIDNLSLGVMENLSRASEYPDFQFILCDVRDRSILDELPRHDVIVHMAAYKIEVPGLRGTDILEVNSLGTAAMLKLACNWQSQFVFASTSDVYGLNREFPFSEDQNLILGESTVSRWGYAASKIFDEHLCFANKRENNLNTLIIRYFNTYGPRHELSPRSGGPQALFFDALLRDGKMTIHGDGQQQRCFAYISDSIEMTALAIESDRTEGEILNIGNPNNEISIIDLARLAYEVSGGKGELPVDFITHEKAYQSKKFHEVSRRIPDISKAIRLLGFKPTVDNRQGMTRTFNWQKDLPCYRTGQ